MGKINYKKLLLKLIEDKHHDLNKIEKVIIDSKKENYAYLSFEEIIEDKEWNAEEKEKLLRLHGYEKYEPDLKCINKYSKTKKESATVLMIMFGNLSGFNAYMNCFKDIERHHNGITKDEAYRNILDLINAQTSEEYVERKEIMYSKVFTKEKELEFMKVALSILSEEDKKRLCADFYEAHSLKSVSNKSIFINIIKTCNIELVDEYIQYIDNISPYFSYAVATGNIAIVKHFLDLGANINYYPNEPIYGLLTPLKTAITNNDYEMVKFLLDNGANVDLSVQESDFINKLHNTTLNIIDRWNYVHPEKCKEDDEDVKDLQYLRTSTPLEYATTINHLHEYRYHQYLISFEGNTNYINNNININILPKYHTEEQINRAKIIKLLYDKSDKNKMSYATNLICSALITQDTENINIYINYIIENNIEIDINKVFDIFLSLNLNDYNKLTNILIKFIEKYSNNPSKFFKKLFNMYLEKNIKNCMYYAFSSDEFTNTLLNRIDSCDRKNIILMPYVKNIETVKDLLELGFDINQLDENGRNILFGLLSDRYSWDDIIDEEKELFKFLTTINPETNERLINIAHRDNNNKNALFYGLQRFDTKEEFRYGSKEKVYTYTNLEGVIADFIDMLPLEEVNNPDIIEVLENRMTEYLSNFGEKILADFVYQHHKKLMEAFRKKITFSDKIYKEIFKELYPTDKIELELLNARVQVDSSLDFVYEILDKNTKVQKLSIDNNYDSYIKYLTKTNASFKEFLCIFKKLISDLDELKLFYDQNITRRYNQSKYLEYVKNKYNVSYSNLPFYALKMIIFGIKKYGSDKLPLILELCPGYDINTIVYDKDIDMSYYTHLADVTFGSFDNEGNPTESTNRFEAVGIVLDENDNILFTGSLIHYGILTNDVKLVQYLKNIGANAKLIINGEDHSWDYVNSNEMADLLEPEIGPRNLAGFNEEERKYILSL